MIGLDTNVLIRYLVQDDPIQSPKATRLIERELSEGNPGFITAVTMTEVAWVLDRVYSLPARELATRIERILQADVFVVAHEQQVFGAMVALSEGAGDFADALVGLLGERAGCAITMTFDRKAARLRQFALLA